MADTMSKKQTQITHLDERGAARMVDVGQKPVTARQAIAEGFVQMQGRTLRAIADEKIPKGEVIATARIAGIMAAKRCGEPVSYTHLRAHETPEHLVCR